MVAAGAQLVEVLPSPDYEEDHLPGAVHLPLRTLDSEARTVLVVACALPYANITDNSVSQTTPSIFKPGYPGALWYAVEPVAVAALGIAAGVMLIALRGRIPRALAAGVLLGLGAQTFLLFLGYVGSSANGPSERAAIGGAIGVAGGLVVATGGALAAVSLSVTARPAP